VRPLQDLGRRLAAPDAQQYLALYLIALLFALLASWPATAEKSNDAWFSLAYTRAAVLGLLGLGYGVGQARVSRRERRSTATMLAVFALLALPLEVSAYAATYPATPLPWILALPALTVTAMFAIGSILGLLLDLARLRFLAPLLIPAVLAGMVAFDVTIGVNLLNPFTAAVRLSWSHLAVLLLTVGALLFALLRPLGGSNDRAVNGNRGG
jgi:hypothetical protein